MHISKLYIKCRVTSHSQYTKDYMILKLRRNTFEVIVSSMTVVNVLENGCPNFSKV